MAGTPGRPRLAVGRLPPLCRVGPRLLTMTGFFRMWMANHFAAPDTIEDPALQQFVWSPDPAATGIMIESSSKWVPELTEHRPAIVIKRGSWRPLRMGINNRLFGTDKPGTFYYANYWQGSHVLFCCSGADGECEHLATEVYRELNEFGPRLETLLGLFRFEVVEVGELATLEEANQNFVVPITVAYVMEEVWAVDTEAPLFTKLDMAVVIP